MTGRGVILSRWAVGVILSWHETGWGVVLSWHETGWGVILSWHETGWGVILSWHQKWGGVLTPPVLELDGCGVAGGRGKGSHATNRQC